MKNSELNRKAYGMHFRREGVTRMNATDRTVYAALLAALAFIGLANEVLVFSGDGVSLPAFVGAAILLALAGGILRGGVKSLETHQHAARSSVAKGAWRPSAPAPTQSRGRVLASADPKAGDQAPRPSPGGISRPSSI